MTVSGVDAVAEAITEHWGERCPDFNENCWCCQAWAQFDRLCEGAGD